MRILFLCMELAGYFASSIRILRELYDVDVLVVSRPNTEPAPFRLALGDIRHISRQAVTNEGLLQASIDFRPDIIYVAGWTDKGYLRIAQEFKRKGRVVICGLDNPWRGNYRQRLACLLSVGLVRPFFSHLWVAGHTQYEYARRLGFGTDQILVGLYAADVDMFTSIRNNAKSRQLVFAGRLEAIKGADILYKVFAGLTADERNGWSLLLIGNGYLKEALKPTTTIEIEDFLQPDQLISRVSKSGAFILPSLYEPWGVVAHEFGAIGVPLLLSDAVNSGSQFLIHGYNGLVFKAGDEAALRDALTRFFRLSPEAKAEMGRRSALLADMGHPRYWAARLVSLAR